MKVKTPHSGALNISQGHLQLRMESGGQEYTQHEGLKQGILEASTSFLSETESRADLEKEGPIVQSKGL